METGASVVTSKVNGPGTQARHEDGRLTHSERGRSPYSEPSDAADGAGGHGGQKFGQKPRCRNSVPGVSDPREVPDDEVLLELGRVGYAAIQLEPIIDWFCRVIEGPGGQDDRRPRGTQVKSARKALEAGGTFPERSRILDWLTRADDAMERRNSVFHGDPIIEWNVFGEEDMAAGDVQLLHRSRRSGGQVTRTPLTVEGLQDVLAELEGAMADWLDVFKPLATWRFEENRRREVGNADAPALTGPENR